jgi:UDP-galactopyranose mutase
LPLTDRHDVILGAGLTGLSAAYAFQQGGEDHWQTYEQEERVGGHARSIVRDGYTFDYGPHILFAADTETEDLIRDLLAGNFRAQKRQAFIYHQAFGLHTRFPFQAHLHGLPKRLVADCLIDLVAAIEHQARGEFAPANYEEWMRGFFGTTIAEHLMIPYARKVWTVEPTEMDFNWIGRRVPTPDFARVISGALGDDVEQVGVTADFWYPLEGGIEALPKALGERVHGLHLNRRLERIELSPSRLHFTDGSTVAFDHAVYTLPLHRVAELMPAAPQEIVDACAALRYQGILCVNVAVDAPALSDMHWVYFYEDAFPFHRLSFPANFSPANVPPGKSSVSIEVAYSPDRPLDVDDLVERTLAALRAANILDADHAVEFVDTAEILPAYVIYDLDHARNVALIRDWLAEAHIFAAGRFGEWQYLNMDHAMRSGRDTAREILARRVVGGRNR